MTLLTCPTCGKLAISETAHFCGSCRTPLVPDAEFLCPSCDAPCGPSENSCKSCGENLHPKASIFCPCCGAAAMVAGAQYCESCRTPLSAETPPPAKPTPAHVQAGCRCAKPDFDEDGYCQTCGKKAAYQPSKPEWEGCADENLVVASDVGRRHKINQDYGAVVRGPYGLTLMVVADGVSTSDNAEAASYNAVRAVVDSFKIWDGEGTLTDQAKVCIAAASEAVNMTPVDVHVYGPPATTIVVLIARQEEAGMQCGIAWVGDSRAYSVMPSLPATLLTRDDSWCMDEVESGRMTYEQALHDPNAHAITQWLGMDAGDVEIHTEATLIPAGATAMLCTDGLWNYADGASQMGKSFTNASQEADLAETARRLVAFANNSGGSDNITVALMRA